MARVELPESRLSARKRRRFVRIAAGLIVFLLFISSGLVGLTYWSELQIKDVSISGTQTLSSGTVEAFVRDRLGEDFAYLIKRTGTPRFFKIFHRKTFRSVLPFIGGLIIASPLPDELGLTLLGLARMRPSRFLLLSFTFNSIGILLIALAAHSLS